MTNGTAQVIEELNSRIEFQKEHIRSLWKRYNSLDELLTHGVASPYTRSTDAEEISSQRAMTKSSIEMANAELQRLIGQVERMKDARK